MAAPLTDYLTTGTYRGIDIVSRSVEWCQQAYSRFPNFRFHHSEIYNKHYHPHGISAADYRFPFEDRSFDFIFLTSVFTHMLPADVAHYLSEIERVLDDDGRILFTVFLLNERPLTERAHFSFRHDMGGCLAEDREVPEKATAYREADLFGMIESAGLKVSAVHYGRWRGSEGLSGQDILIAERGGNADTV